MSKREKLRRKLRNNPNNATTQEITTLLGYFGFELARVRGSHHIFEYQAEDVSVQIVISVHGRKVKRVYTINVIEIIDTLFPEEVEGEEDGDE